MRVAISSGKRGISSGSERFIYFEESQKMGRKSRFKGKMGKKSESEGYKWQKNYLENTGEKSILKG